MTFCLEVLNTKYKIFSDSVRKIHISGSEGNLGIYPGHIQFLTTIKPGLLYIVTHKGKKEYIYISGGIMEIQPHKVMILADKTIYGKDINKIEILKNKKEAEKKLKKHNKKSDVQKIKKIIIHLQAQLEVIKKMESSRLKQSKVHFNLE